jgi:hypothetical protein
MPASITAYRAEINTALRDADLVKRGALTKDPGGGRSTSHSLVTE